MKFSPVKFPRDENPHKCFVEWWYFNGHLHDKHGQRYSFMDCLFKIDATKANLAFLPKALGKEVYFAHSLLTNVKTQRTAIDVKYLALASHTSLSRELLNIEYTDIFPQRGYNGYHIIETRPGEYQVKTHNLFLVMRSTKPPLLEDGRGFVTVNGKDSYYYSLTNLETWGEIRIGGKVIDVVGKSWMDHQWANAPYSEDKWTWVSIQLDNNTEFVALIYGSESKQTKLATIIYPNGRQVSTNEVSFVSTKTSWVSSRTKAKYQLSWNIQIPKYNLFVQVEPLVKNQEVLFGNINYWEGPLSVRALMNGKEVNGQGYLELMGYPTRLGKVKLLEHEIARAFKHMVVHSERKALHYVKSLI